jgi:hypothetical protein
VKTVGGTSTSHPRITGTDHRGVRLEGRRGDIHREQDRGSTASDRVREMATAVVGGTGSCHKQRPGPDLTRILDHGTGTDTTIALDERVILEEFKQTGGVLVHHTFTTSVIDTETL